MATVMSIISALILFLKSVPDLIKIFNQIAGLISDAGSAIDRSNRAKEIHDAVKSARDTGDTSSLEDLISPKPAALIASSGFDIKFIEPPSAAVIAAPEEKKSPKFRFPSFQALWGLNSKK